MDNAISTFLVHIQPPGVASNFDLRLHNIWKAFKESLFVIVGSALEFWLVPDGWPDTSGFGEGLKRNTQPVSAHGTLF